MPLLRVDVIEGRSQDETQALLDALHECVITAFGVPERDRFQILTEHPPGQMVIQDVGLDFDRTEQMVVVQMTTTPRTLASRKLFFRTVAEVLRDRCGISPQDIVVNIVTTSESDWSFGEGKPQFLTGDL